MITLLTETSIIRFEPIHVTRPFTDRFTFSEVKGKAFVLLKNAGHWTLFRPLNNTAKAHLGRFSIGRGEDLPCAVEAPFVFSVENLFDF